MLIKKEVSQARGVHTVGTGVTGGQREGGLKRYSAFQSEIILEEEQLPVFPGSQICR